MTLSCGQKSTLSEVVARQCTRILGVSSGGVNSLQTCSVAEPVGLDPKNPATSVEVSFLVEPTHRGHPCWLWGTPVPHCHPQQGSTLLYKSLDIGWTHLQGSYDTSTWVPLQTFSTDLIWDEI